MKKTPAYKNKTIRTVKCKSGAMGFRTRLQNNYSNFNDFKYWSRIYDLHLRLGYPGIRSAWLANNVIESSINPSDFRVVYR